MEPDRIVELWAELELDRPVELALDKLRPAGLVLGMRLVLALDTLAELALLALGRIVVVVGLGMTAELELGRIVVVALDKLAEMALLALGTLVEMALVLAAPGLDRLAELVPGRIVVGLETWVELAPGRIVVVALGKLVEMEPGRIVGLWAELELDRPVELALGRIVVVVVGLGMTAELAPGKIVVVVVLDKLAEMEPGRIVGLWAEPGLDRPVELLQLELGRLAGLGMWAEMIDTADIVGTAGDSRSSKV
jgi:hypothetical protein